MTKTISVYLEDIINSIEHIQRYTKNSTLREFEKSEIIFDAVLRRFQVMGEATKRIPIEFKQEHSEIPWSLITGMRNVLIHDYDDINIERLWQTIYEDLSPLKKQLKDLLKTFS
ncbi:MAG: HepT-like ribonuclease domain-containing protein [Nitrosotalea sp.]